MRGGPMRWLILLGFIPILIQVLMAQSATDRFVGTWKLVSYEQRRANGEVTYPKGRQPVGVLAYTRGGQMSAQIMPEANAAWPADYYNKATQEQLRAAMLDYVAYFGTFTVNEAEKTVVHHVQGSVNPGFLRTDQKRSYEFSGNRLILSLTRTVNGEDRSIRLTWERVE